MSQKNERILALFFVPLSFMIATVVLFSLITIMSSTVQYFKLVKLKEEYQPKFEALKRDDDLWKIIHPNEIRTTSTFILDLNPYREAGVDNINPFDPSAPQQVIDKQSDNIISQILIITLCFFSSVIPWMLIRVFYWVKTADRTL